MEYEHIPVMLSEAVKFLDPKPGENFIDCTLGGGGYAFALAGKIRPGGTVLAIDADRLAIDNAKKRMEQEDSDNLILIHDNFVNLEKIYIEHFKNNNREASGVVFDLGLSSAQLKDRERGFSFRFDAPLDMGFGHDGKDKEIAGAAALTTADIVNKFPQKKLENILSDYGEEKYARRIAQAIVKARKKKTITRTDTLIEIIGRSVPENYKHRKLHFATKTFQALRIATNDELNNLTAALSQALAILPRGGRIVTAAYHSLEDRIIKNYFRRESRDCVCPRGLPECCCGHSAQIALLSKKAVQPDSREIEDNPRARSAKLRAAIKL